MDDYNVWGYRNEKRNAGITDTNIYKSRDTHTHWYSILNLNQCESHARVVKLWIKVKTDWSVCSCGPRRVLYDFTIYSTRIYNNTNGDRDHLIDITFSFNVFNCFLCCCFRTQHISCCHVPHQVLLMLFSLVQCIDRFGCVKTYRFVALNRKIVPPRSDHIAHSVLSYQIFLFLFWFYCHLTVFRKQHSTFDYHCRWFSSYSWLSCRWLHWHFNKQKNNEWTNDQAKKKTTKNRKTITKDIIR